ncbi:MAG: HD domain-containing protein [Candidatus Moduliflexus flocculans]|nr:HD domain-containing protein [Candidatus Moduliflexus flocculans]
MSACETMRDTIVDEVASKVEKIDCIGQLRIFDEYTFSHILNVSSMSVALGLLLGLKEQDISSLAMGALLHDIGKMKIPKKILNKPSRLEPQEFEIMKNHAKLGYDYIKNEMKLSEKIAEVALDHQERYNGGGYPRGLKARKYLYMVKLLPLLTFMMLLYLKEFIKKGFYLMKR